MWPAAAAFSLLLGASAEGAPPLLRWFLIIGACWAGAEAVVQVAKKRQKTSRP